MKTTYVTGDRSRHWPVQLCAGIMLVCTAVLVWLMCFSHTHGLDAELSYFAENRIERPTTVTLASNIEKGLQVELFPDADPKGQPEKHWVMNHGPLDLDWRTVCGKDLFSLRMTGFLKVAAPGTLRLRIASDDGVRIYIGDELLLDTWGMHKELLSTGEVILQGPDTVLPVTIEYCNILGRSHFHLEMAEPGKAFKTVLAENFECERTTGPELTVLPVIGTFAGRDPGFLPQGLRVLEYDNPELSSPAVKDYISTGAVDYVFNPPASGSSFGARYQGYMNFPNAGEYVLALTSDDGSRLFIDNAIIIENWGAHQSIRRMAKIAITNPGLLPFQISYQNIESQGKLLLEWIPPGEHLQGIPSTMFHQAHDLELFPEVTKLTSPTASTAGGSPGLLLVNFGNSDLQEFPVSINRWAGQLFQTWDIRAGEHFSCLYVGYLKCPRKGRYKFRLTSDDGSRIIVGNQILINNWGPHPKTSVTEVCDVETAGLYPFRLEYQNAGGDAYLKVELQFEGGGWQVLDHNNFSHDPPDQALNLNTFFPKTVKGASPYKFHLRSATIPRSYSLFNLVYGGADYNVVPEPYVTPTTILSGHAHFTVAHDGAYGFRYESSLLSCLLIDDKVISSGDSVALSAGHHKLDLQLRLPESIMEDKARERMLGLSLRWMPPEAKEFVPMPRQALLRPSCLPNAGVNWIFGGVLTIGLVLIMRSFVGRRFARPNRSKLGLMLLSIPVIVLALFVRLEQREAFPAIGENTDELQELWVGKSLTEVHRPISWLLWQHTDRQPDTFPFQFFGTGFQVSEHYLGHPPLYGVLCYLLTPQPRSQEFFQVHILQGRYFNIALGVFNLILLLCIGFRICTWQSTLIAGLMYAVCPFIVHSSIMVKCDQLLASLTVLGLFLCVYSMNKPRLIVTVGICVVSFLGVWAKESGTFLSVAAAIYLFRLQRPKAACLAFASGIAGGISYIVYGIWIGGPDFENLVQASAERLLNWDVGMKLWTNFKICYFEMAPTLGIAILLWVSFFGNDRRALQPAVMFATMYLVVLTVTIDVRYTYGQYALPLYPIMVLCFGNYVQQTYRKLSIAGYLGLFSFGILVSVGGFRQWVGELSPFALRTLILLFFTVPLLAWMFPRVKQLRALTKCLFVIVIAGVMFINMALTLSIPSWY